MRIPSFLTRQSLSEPVRNTSLAAVSWDNIGIASPCPANWATMTGDSRVRHCPECKLNVYNLSDMTRAEAERLIANREGRLCVRFFRRADGTILTRDCPRGLRALTSRVSRVAGAVLAAMMTVTPGFTQPQTAAGSSSQAGDKDSQLGLDITVFDPTGAVIQNARVTVCRCNEKSLHETNTDANGVARFRGLGRGTYQITVQARGFASSRQTIAIEKPEQVQAQVRLKIGSETTTVEVSATMGVVMGGITTTTDTGSSWLLDLPLR